MEPSIATGNPFARRRFPWAALACAALVLAGLAAYSDSFRGPFVFDDVDFVNDQRSKTLRPIWPTLIDRRPVVHFTMALCYCIGGPSEFGYHIFNLAVHLLAALALFGIVRRTLTIPALKGRFEPKAAMAIAFSAALLWMLHPLQTQAVTYVVQRLESLMGLFYFLTLYCFIRSTSSPNPVRWHAATIFSCLLGMGSKEVMVSAPLIVLLYDRIFITGSFGETLRRRWGLYLALAATWNGLGHSLGAAVTTQPDWAGFHLSEHTPLEYARTEFGVILHYLRLAFLPIGLCLDYDDWPIAKGFWDTVPQAVVVCGLLAATFWALVRRPRMCPPTTQPYFCARQMWGFAGAWFFLALAPTSSIMPIRDVAFEHRMYVPLAAVIVPGTIAAYLLIERFARRLSDSEAAARRAGGVIEIVLVAAITGIFGTLTFLRNQDYQSTITLWKDTVVKRKDNARAWGGLGTSYMVAGDYDEAIRCFTEQIRLKPQQSSNYSNRAMAYLFMRRFDEALRDCNMAITADPNYAVAWNNRGNVYFQSHRFPEAIRDFDQAIKLDPNYFDAIYNRGKAYANLNALREAVRDFDRALELRPQSALAYFGRGSAYALLGRPDQAIGDLTSAIELNPNFPQAYNGRGKVVAATGRPLEALADFDMAIEQKPDYAEAYFDRGTARGDAGRLDGALSDYGKAIELNPRFSEAYNNRGKIYGDAGRVPEAIRDFSKAIELKPANAEPYFNRAVMYSRVNEFDKALADVREFQRLGGKPDPEFVQALIQSATHGK